MKDYPEPEPDPCSNAELVPQSPLRARSTPGMSAVQPAFT